VAFQAYQVPFLSDIIGNTFSHATHRLRLGQAAQRSQRNMMFLYLGFVFKPFARFAALA
jgi:hypothetical protein